MPSFIGSLTQTAAAEEDNPLWLIVLCDLMTNLMLFFLILYSFTLKSEEERAKLQASLRGEVMAVRKTEVPEEAARELQTVEQLRRELEAAGMKDTAHVDVTEGHIRVRLPDAVFFRSGSAALTRRARGDLGPVGRMLQALPAHEVVVEGHTDSVPISAGTYRTNWELSVARSEAVIRRLTRTHGLADSRFVAAGYGEFRPLAANDTREGRLKNRRFEIVVVRKGGEGGRPR